MDRELDVVAIGHVEGAMDLLGAGGDVLVDLEPAAAQPQRLLHRLGPGRGAAHEQDGVERARLEGRPGGGQPLARVRPEVHTGP